MLVDFLQEIAKIVTMLVAALLPLLALTERLEDEEELARRYNVHQENDFRAPDFDLSRLKVREKHKYLLSIEGAILGEGRGARMPRGTPASNCL